MGLEWYHQRMVRNMKRLTKTDCGGLEFQLGYYTVLNCKVLAQTQTKIDVAMVMETNFGLSELEYIIELKNTDDGIKFKTLTPIHGRTDKETMMDYTFAIERALQSFNWLWIK